MSEEAHISHLKGLASPVWDAPPLVWIDPPSRPQAVILDYQAVPAAPEVACSPRP